MTLTQEDIDKACLRYPTICREYMDNEDEYNTIKEEHDNLIPADVNYADVKKRYDAAKLQYENAYKKYNEMLQTYEETIRKIDNTKKDVDNAKKGFDKLKDDATKKFDDIVEDITGFFSPVVIIFIVLTIIQTILGFTLFSKDMSLEGLYLFVFALFVYLVFTIYLWWPEGRNVLNYYPDITLIVYLIVAGGLLWKCIPKTATAENIIGKIVQYFCILTWTFIVLATIYYFLQDTFIMENLGMPIYFMIFGAMFFFSMNMMFTGFMYIFRNNSSFPTEILNGTNIISLYTKWFVALICFVALIFSIIHWFSRLVDSMSSTYGIVNFIVNIIGLIIILAVTQRILIGTDLYNNNPYVQLVTETLLYIPCIFVDFIDYFVKMFNFGSTTNDELDKNGNVTKTGSTTSMFNPSTTDYILLGSAVGVNAVYWGYPYGLKYINNQGGVQLVNNPVYTNNSYTLADYKKLHQSDSFDYQYAISFWSFIDATGPSVGKAYSNYTSILNYGGKPNILYNSRENTLMITLDIDEPSGIMIKPPYNPDNFDEDGNYIIYKNTNMQLQKWNNFVINYNGGTIDIFLNGELVKSVNSVIPYMSYDNLVIGEENGVQGGICNVTYFTEPLTMDKIFYLYNTVKMFTPPVVSYSNETIVEIAKKVPESTNKNTLWGDDRSRALTNFDKLFAQEETTVT